MKTDYVELTLTATPASGGTVTGDGWKKLNSSVTINASPAKGYKFVNWTKGTTPVSTSQSYSFSITANTNLIANFTLDTPVNDPSENQFRIWPNPVNSELRISGMTSRGVLKLIDLSGKMVYITSSTSSEIIVPMGAFQPGIYLLTVETTEGRQVEKIVRQ